MIMTIAAIIPITMPIITPVERDFCFVPTSPSFASLLSPGEEVDCEDDEDECVDSVVDVISDWVLVTDSIRVVIFLL